MKLEDECAGDAYSWRCPKERKLWRKPEWDGMPEEYEDKMGKSGIGPVPVYM